MAFRPVKGKLSAAERRPFAASFAAFCKGTDNQRVAQPSASPRPSGVFGALGLSD